MVPDHSGEAEELIQDFLCKPFTRERLMEAVQRLLPVARVGQHP